MSRAEYADIVDYVREQGISGPYGPPILLGRRIYFTDGYPPRWPYEFT